MQHPKASFLNHSRLNPKSLQHLSRTDPPFWKDYCHVGGIPWGSTGPATPISLTTNFLPDRTRPKQAGRTWKTHKYIQYYKQVGILSSRLRLALIFAKLVSLYVPCEIHLQILISVFGRKFVLRSTPKYFLSSPKDFKPRSASLRCYGFENEKKISSVFWKDVTPLLCRQQQFQKYTITFKTTSVIASIEFPAHQTNVLAVGLTVWQTATEIIKINIKNTQPWIQINIH